MSRPTNALPRPGPRWGAYPQQTASQGTGEAAPRPSLVWSQHPSWRLRTVGRLAPNMSASWVMRASQTWLDHLHHAINDLKNVPPEQWLERLTHARQMLRRHGWAAQALAPALACVSQAIEHTTGRRLSDQQLLAATMLLDQRLVELPTGEGKSLAMAAAASVAAMAGVPVHVITANDYLAERDCAGLNPLWQHLGLSVGHVQTSTEPDARRQVYAQDIVYTTAKEVAFDHLRDHLGGLQAQAPVLRGLCLALVDEADSILLDEAVVPLIISSTEPLTPAAQGQRRALWWQALKLAQALHWGEDANAAGGLRVRLSAAGLSRLQALTAHLGGPWRRQRLKQDLVEQALTALHLLNLDQHYVVRDKGIELLDTLTGRLAEGRVWSQGLQTLIELKEGCHASAPTQTLAQTTFQRFFRRYWHLAGLSGTLVESRDEFKAVYGLSIVTLPPRQPSRRLDFGLRVFDTPEQRWQAAVQAVTIRHHLGQPILIGTDTVADSEALSACLHAACLPHQVLNARHDQREADIVAQAGRQGAITVSTRMAGRGTDIELDEQAIRVGGLHVICCQNNESGRMDRQLLGRAARQGQPGSTETWICHGISTRHTGPDAPILLRCNAIVTGSFMWRQRFCQAQLKRLTQGLATRRQALARRHLLERDRQWEQQHHSAQQQGSGMP